MQKRNAWPDHTHYTTIPFSVEFGKLPSTNTNNAQNAARQIKMDSDLLKIGLDWSLHTRIYHWNQGYFTTSKWLCPYHAYYNLNIPVWIRFLWFSPLSTTSIDFWAAKIPKFENKLHSNLVMVKKSHSSLRSTWACPCTNSNAMLRLLSRTAVHFEGSAERKLKGNP